MALAQPQLQAQARFVRAAAANAGVELDESRWVSEVRRRMEAVAEELGAVAMVFDVPRLLRSTRPEAYTPQHFALGPYHYQRPGLRDMERYKLAAAKRAEQLFAPHHTFDHLVQNFVGMQDKIRAPYHRFLELNEQTLSWMMAIDTCFLLDFLEKYHVDKATDLVSSSPNWINATVRDAMMLENQIPLFLFTAALQLRHGSEEAAADAMRVVLDRFIRDVCPIKTNTPALTGDIAEHGHLLELLYHFLVPASAVSAQQNAAKLPPLVPEVAISLDAHGAVEEQQVPDTDKVQQACMQVSSLDVPPARFIKNLITKPMSLVSSLPGWIVGKVPQLSGVAQLLGKLMASTDVAALLKGVNLGTIIKSPLAQEIMIPSVAQLAACGVRFLPAPEGVAGIAFDAATATLTLPVLHLDSNTDVILRNLVAYETAAVRGPLVLARYTELMNGIIDTPRDVKILTGCGIIVNGMKSNKEAADMWNGMCRAVRPSKAPLLDCVITEVNAHRNRSAAVRARKMLKRYVFRSWKVLTLLATVVLLLMTALQTFCTVYDCKRWFGGRIPQLTAGGGQ
ncbi:putative UPF0481 protein At3g02645 [Triticum dicoccoides]|uniref:putative UPF0481 protein At3g02645 n=1 Tax=Triticum dicoccoides TaxID=85692 RepID=UPI001891B14F|nr:putative UPF0481 protein At3g02645 [Triticum dicoccoides]